MASLIGFQTIGTGESRPPVLFPAKVLGFIHIMGDIGIRGLVHSPHPVIAPVSIPNLVVIEPVLGYEGDPCITGLERTGVVVSS